MKYAKCIQSGREESYWHFWFTVHRLVRPTYNIIPEDNKFKRLERIKQEA